MSAFLGPIHYWLFNKIKRQQDIVNEIFAISKEFGITIEEECKIKYGEFEKEPLEEIIDQSNIHGWLQERVSQVEFQYAYAVTELLKFNPTALEQLKTLLFQKGAALGNEINTSELSVPGMFKVISDNLLDGMPCDHANSLVDQNENEVVWKRNLCVHEDYWSEAGGDISVYYELRDAFMEGLTKSCGMEFEKLGPATYRIKKH
ncbi:MAG: hypothetical protein K0S47_514 [Herbinix sp.]|jgi:hypothetical protein|nr:hypothetical protein [Herbinix sp.]